MLPPDFFRICKASLSRAGKNLSGFLFPNVCVVCQNDRPAGSAWLCGACLSLLAANHERRDACPFCSQNRRTVTCACDYAWDFPFERIYSLFDFDDTLKAIAHAFKYGGLKKLAFDMGRAYVHLIPPSFLEGMDIAVVVPLHFLRACKRGYNQAEYFGRGIVAAGPSRLKIYKGVLRRKKATTTQTALSKESRMKNLAAAFCVAPDKKQLLDCKNVILVDDIVTTGATASQCATALLEGGAKKVRVLSLARD